LGGAIRSAAGDNDVPQGEAKWQVHAEQIGCDGHRLLAAVATRGAPAWLREIPAVELLPQVCVQNFCLIGDVATGEREACASIEASRQVRWWTDRKGFSPSLMMVATPYDPGVHYANKRSTIWIGYKVHLTEACHEGSPHPITHVETMPAPASIATLSTPSMMG